MGGFMSTRDYEQYREYDDLAVQLQTYFEEHRHDLNTIFKTVNAQKNMMSLLEKLNAKTHHDSGDHSEHVYSEDNTSLKDLMEIQQRQLKFAENSFENIKSSLAYAIDGLIGKGTPSSAFVNLKKELQSYKAHEHKENKTAHAGTSHSVGYTTEKTEHLQDQVNVIKHEICSIKEWCTVANPENKSLLVHEKNQRITRLEHELKLEKESIEKLKREKSKLGDRLYESQYHLEQMKRRENEQMRRRNEVKPKYQKKRNVSLQLYHQRNDDSMRIIVDGVDNIVKQRLYQVGIDAIIEHCSTVDKLKTDVPILVLCIFASRLGTDCSAAMTGISNQHQASLLIFHHKDNATPVQKSSRQLTTSEFKELGGIFDLLFTKGRGIYECDFNTDAFNSIIEYITSKCGT